MSENGNDRSVPESTEERLTSQPHLFLRLAENALTVAESVRDNYLRNTARLVDQIIGSLNRANPPFRIDNVSTLSWDDVRDEVVTFIDGGVGQVQIASRVPILLRVGSYSVRTGERRLSEREHFGYYPIILGDLEGGRKDRKDFIDIVRITAELLGGLSALERTPDLRVLMFHGPLVYLMGGYAGHTPFSERDIDLFLRQYAVDPATGRDMKDEFQRQAKLWIYPSMVPGRSDLWAAERVFEPLAWIAYLCQRLMRTARDRNPVPLIAGVVERGNLTEFSRKVVFKELFRRLRMKNREEYFNKMFGRSDLNSEDAIVERLGYSDALLLAMLLNPGQFSQPWQVEKYGGLRTGNMSLLNSSLREPVDWGCLAPWTEIGRSYGFPAITGAYVQVSDKTEPIRVEVFSALGESQIAEAVSRAYLYAQLLPGYGFPVGLDIADKHAHVPSWLTDAYGKLIRFHLSASLQRGDITDRQMQRILVQAIYMRHRDWLFRPDA